MLSRKPETGREGGKPVRVGNLQGKDSQTFVDYVFPEGGHAYTLEIYSTAPGLQPAAAAQRPGALGADLLARDAGRRRQRRPVRPCRGAERRWQPARLRRVEAAERPQSSRGRSAPARQKVAGGPTGGGRVRVMHVSGEAAGNRTSSALWSRWPRSARRSAAHGQEPIRISQPAVLADGRRASPVRRSAAAHR
jgi:hypothetical protein